MAGTTNILVEEGLSFAAAPDSPVEPLKSAIDSESLAAEAVVEGTVAAFPAGIVAGPGCEIGCRKSCIMVRP